LWRRVIVEGENTENTGYQTGGWGGLALKLSLVFPSSFLCNFLGATLLTWGQRRAKGSLQRAAIARTAENVRRYSLYRLNASMIKQKETDTPEQSLVGMLMMASECL
jgi:hypothetical protein